VRSGRPGLAGGVAGRSVGFGGGARPARSGLDSLTFRGDNKTMADKLQILAAHDEGMLFERAFVDEEDGQPRAPRDRRWRGLQYRDANWPAGGWPSLLPADRHGSQLELANVYRHAARERPGA